MLTDTRDTNMNDENVYFFLKFENNLDNFTKFTFYDTAFYQMAALQGFTVYNVIFFLL